MKFLHRALLVSFFLAVFYFTISPAVLAQDEIISSQKVTYQVFEDGRTRVTHDVRLTNLTTNYYASEYSLLLGYTDVINVRGSDGGGQLKIDVTKKKDGADMHVVFNEEVVGKGKVLAFTLSYDTHEIASKNGRIWEINIPKISDNESLGDYTIALLVPPAFGKASYIKPIPSDSSTQTTLVFSKTDALIGVSVAFGEYQLFDFTLAYHLLNDRLYPVITEIALPPTTAYQEVLLNKLEPAPLTAYQDTDGNWLARYRLEASQRLDISAGGKVKIFAGPQLNGSGTTEDIEQYLRPAKYWDIQDSEIVEKARQLRTPRAIYDYVVDTLSYNVSRIGKNTDRIGAKGILEKPDSAICMEFTDLFIALARAAGIPAREIDGFAFTRNQRYRPLSLAQADEEADADENIVDILHAWPEYFDADKNTWIAVDPTWGDTSGVDYFDVFDFNHFAFVLKGLDSQYPSPAGSYKEAGDIEKKDVEVVFSQNDDFEKRERIVIASDLPAKIIGGFKTSVNLSVRNVGNTLLTPGEIVLTSERLRPSSQRLTVTAMPPFSNLELTAYVQSHSYFDTYDTTLRAQASGMEFLYSVSVSPFYLVYLPWIGGGIGTAVIIIAAVKARRLYIQRQREESIVRRKG